MSEIQASILSLGQTSHATFRNKAFTINNSRLSDGSVEETDERGRDVADLRYISGGAIRRLCSISAPCQDVHGGMGKAPMAWSNATQ